MIDILYPARGRPEFTEASLRALVANTDWTRARLVIYTDGDGFHGLPVLHRGAILGNVETVRLGGPVAVMNHYLAGSGTEIFAKIDNDTIVPPGWLEAGLAVMERYPELGLLGIEPPQSRTAAPWAPKPVTCMGPCCAHKRLAPAPELSAPAGSGYAFSEAIGGIGFMRRSVFGTPDKMRPHSIYGGFTDWQLQHPEVKKGWIVPPLNVFLLDRLPIEPWATLSRRYIEHGCQRPWTNYDPAAHELWDWWLTEPRPKEAVLVS